MISGSIPSVLSSAAEEKAELLYGDITLDGSLTTEDAALLQDHLLCKNALSEEQLQTTDIIQDDSVNVFDLARLKQLLMNPDKPLDETIELNGNTYTLSLFDDFSGDTLDDTIWSPCPEWERSDAGAYWDNDRISLDGNGNLVLSVDKDEENNRYSSGAVRTKEKFQQTYGYFETRCKLQDIEGFWSAFWLMGDTVLNVDGSGEDGTEIDIMESAYLSESCIRQALHYDGYGEAHQNTSIKYQMDGLYEGYHTYGLEWTPEEYIFYVDGTETWRTSYGGVCRNPLYLKLSTEVGTWAGTLNENDLPGEFLVDYVKVYACEDFQTEENENLLPSIENWTHYVNAGRAELTMDEANQEIRAAVSEAGTIAWDIQAQARNLPLVNGQIYQVQFDASCTTPTITDVGLLRQDGEDYPAAWSYSVELTEEMQTFTYTFTMRKETMSDWFLYLNFGSSTGDYTFRNLKLTELGTNLIPEVSAWTHYASTGTATFSPNADIHALNTSVTETGTYEWDIQAQAHGASLEQGKKYELTFEASCTEENILPFGFCRNDNGSYPCCYASAAKLTPELNRYRFTFNMSGETQSDWYLFFNYAMGCGDYFLQNVALREIGTADIKPESDMPYSYTVSELCCERDGKNIYGLAYVPDTAEKVPLVILSHELNNTHETMKAYAEALAGNGYAAYIYDFCGGSASSKSDGATTEMSVMTEKADLEAVLTTAKTWSFVDTNRILLLGGSQGGVVTSLAAADHADEIAGTILLYPAYSIFDIIHERFSELSEVPDTFVWNGWLDVGRCYAADIWETDPYSEISAYTMPVLILHSTQDAVMDISYS